MGYIAPIPHYQYKQYQEREIKVEKNPFRFFPVQSVRPLKNKSQAHSEESETANYVHHLNHKTTPYHTLTEPSISSKLLAQLTGKGKHVNEYV
jgi:hypothetical protein